MGDTSQKKRDREMVAHPDIDWLDDEVPKATFFEDTYFSRAGGLAETRHVFLAGNDLPERWKGRDRFTIAELGFGTGLNFLTTLTALHETAEAPRLTFVSFELYPMSADQLARALSAFSVLEREAGMLVDQWSPSPGWSKLSFDRADLWLGIGDARQIIGEMGGEGAPTGPVDAWFLDGFSPAKNPELWDAELLKTAGAITAESGTFATYTAAGWVRRNLQSAGFTVEKRKGFAGKREMIVGRKAGNQ
jgi:tRNA U34 5-methylaminomethyl-2-thiouridine-forming methyltransferase MnmC